MGGLLEESPRSDNPQRENALFPHTVGFNATFTWSGWGEGGAAGGEKGQTGRAKKEEERKRNKRELQSEICLS